MPFRFEKTHGGEHRYGAGRPLDPSGSGSRRIKTGMRDSDNDRWPDGSYTHRAGTLVLVASGVAIAAAEALQ